MLINNDLTNIMSYCRVMFLVHWACMFKLDSAQRKKTRNCMKDMNMERSNADLCLYFDWTPNVLVMIVSRIDDNLIVRSDVVVKENQGRADELF